MEKEIKSLLKSRQEIKGGKGKVLRSLKDLKPQTAWALVDSGGFVLSAILDVYSFVIFLKKKTAEERVKYYNPELGTRYKIQKVEIRIV